MCIYFFRGLLWFETGWVIKWRFDVLPVNSGVDGVSQQGFVLEEAMEMVNKKKL